MTNAIGLNNNFGIKSSINSTRDSVTKMYELTKEGYEYEGLDDMPASKLHELDDIQLTISSAEKYNIVAKDLVDKTDKALVTVQQMWQKINGANSLIQAYSQGSMAPERLLTMKAQLTDCLSTIATGLNTTYGNGSYVFGAGNNSTIAPVSSNIINNIGNLAADGTVSDSYMLSKSQDRTVKISANIQLNDSIDASDISFQNIIGGIYSALNALNAAPANTYPANLTQAQGLMNKGVSALNTLAANIKDTNDTLKGAIEENISASDDAQQSLDGFKVNYLTEVSKIKEMRRVEEILIALETSMLRDEAKISEMIMSAAR